MQLLNFAIMPAHLQIPTAAGISFGWTVVLSMMRGSTTQAHVEQIQAATADEQVRPCALNRWHVHAPRALTADLSA